MTSNGLSNEYFNWMLRIVDGQNYTLLLKQLHATEFIFTIGLDGNRAEDGVDLRYRFGRERNYPDSMIATYLDTIPCSILEMMVALSIRCEEHIMEDTHVGDRTSRWFWSMIDSLGLSDMSDRTYNYRYTMNVINDFLNHNYKRNGEGGIFTVEDCKIDMRSIEIWYQMFEYLRTIA